MVRCLLSILSLNIVRHIELCYRKQMSNLLIVPCHLMIFKSQLFQHLWHLRFFILVNDALCVEAPNSSVTLSLIFLVKLFHSPFNLFISKSFSLQAYDKTIPFYTYPPRQCNEWSLPLRNVLKIAKLTQQKSSAIVRIWVKNCCGK